MRKIKNPLDHRVLGEQLALFKFNEFAPGIPFFLPKGVFLYHKLQELIRGYYQKYNYQEVMSPMFMNAELWKCSGHYDYFKDNMFFLEDEKYALKPMNCPAHMVLFNSLRLQKKDLPFRMADFGKLFRNESSGSIHGLARVKSFSQDDAHIFLAPEQLEEELRNLLKMVLEIYHFFGFDNFKINLSGRPDQRAGSDDQWDRAESILKNVLKGIDYINNPGEGAFYGPKIDFEVADSQGRFFQLGSIQLDFQLPERFQVEYFEGNQPQRPIVVHRAILGSLERFIAIYLEHCQGWMHPSLCAQEASVLFLNARIDQAAYEKEFKNLHLRYQVKQVDNLKQAIKEFYEEKIPYLIIIGNQEDKQNSVMVKSHKGQKVVPLQDLGLFLKSI